MILVRKKIDGMEITLEVKDKKKYVCFHGNKEIIYAEYNQLNNLIRDLAEDAKLSTKL